jgi:hypothetical protein
MTRTSVSTISLIASLFMIPLSAQALDQCTQFIKSCLTKIHTERDECLDSLRSSPLCIGTESSDLIRRRTLLSPQMSEGPAFLGPMQYDRSCIDRFDETWSRALTETPLSGPRHQSLEEELSKCEQGPALDLSRP